MSYDGIPIPMVFVISLVVAVITWEAAHSTVAKECEKLGAFYVGQKTYDCKVKP